MYTIYESPVLWKIDGGKLEPLIIPAKTIDEALAIARKINRNYNGGHVIRQNQSSRKGRTLQKER